MLFACIYVPEFPVQAIVRTTPELREQPVAVLDGIPPVLTVIAANARAREAGIVLSMTKLKAEACPDVRLCRRSIVRESAAHDALLDCAHGFSPRVEDTNQSSTKLDHPQDNLGDTVILDIDGFDRLFGSPAKIARNIVSCIAKLGLKPNVAIASNPDAAMYAARGFSGVTVISPDTEAKRLDTLPIHLLGPSDEILATLERWGVGDFRGLATLPEVALSQRLGQEGLRLQKLAQGRFQRTLVPAIPAIKFEEAIELEDAVELLEPLVFILNRLLEQICTRLISRALAANELRLTLELTGYEDQTLEEQTTCRAVHERSFQFPVPLQDSRTFLKLLQLDLAAHPPGGPVKKVFLAAEAAPPRFAQSGLFLTRGPAPERLELTLARIRNLAGEDRVGSAELLDTHAPAAFRMRPFRPHANGTKSDKRLSAQPTAMRIFRPPVQTEVQMKHGMPARLFLNGQALHVAIAAGPWRNSGGWWTDQAWTREEWDLELRAEQSSPLLVRVYRDLSSAKWYMQGSFD